MILLIVESPSKAKTIGKYLGSAYKVISSFGHIRGLPSREGAVIPEDNFSMIYEVDARSKKHVAEIVKYAKQADEILLATDPDREGEAISWHISEVLQSKKIKVPIKRVTFFEITKRAILDAVKNPRALDLNLVQAQQARQALDYLYGYTLSPVLWRKLPGSRSAGRVQSVALKIICEREEEIEKFKSQEYWSIEGRFAGDKSPFSAQLTLFNQEKLTKFAIANEAHASEVKDTLSPLSYAVSAVDKKQVKRNPQPPFTTSTLLQDSARKFGFSAKKTAMLAQKLYEGVALSGETAGLITYMRTDSVNLSQDAIDSTRAFAQKNYGDEFVPKSPKYYKTKAKNAQEAHEAIRPTDVSRSPDMVKQYLDADQFKIYSLIWKRTMASQMESAIFDQVIVKIDDEGKKHQFRATGSTLKFEGFLKVYNVGIDDDEDEDKENRLPKMELNQQLSLNEILTKQHFTQPPPRFTEASLVKKMEELGIGRPSTYPSIISVIQEREYVKLDKKRFNPEARGRVVSAFLNNFFKQYVAYDFTAHLEDELDHVSNGDEKYLLVLEKFWHDFKKLTNEVIEYKNSDILEQLQKSLEIYVFGQQSDEKRQCPKCKDGKLQIKMSRFGMFLSCSKYPDCDHRQSIAIGQADEEESTSADGQTFEFPKTLGQDAAFESDILLKKGPYGPYVEAKQNGKVKRSSIPKGKKLEEVELSYALELLALPKVLGKHPETGEDVIANRGRYGPYVGHRKTFVSLKGIDLMDVTFEQALEMISEKESKPSKTKG